MLRIDGEFVKRRLHRNRKNKQKPRTMTELAAMMADEDSPPGSTSYLYSVFRGERDVKLSYAERLSNTLGVTIKELLTTKEAE